MSYPESLKPGKRKLRNQGIYICKKCSARWNGETGTRKGDANANLAIVGQIPDCPACRGEVYEYS